MIVLGVETSCDETSIAAIDGKKILSSFVASQDEVHAPYGGVVPELASRRHMETIADLFNKTLASAKIGPKEIGAIACTYAPGLLGSLLVGLQFAKGLAMSWNKPLIGINHLEGHLNAIYLADDPPYPHLGLIVSGGHTSLYLVQGFGSYKRLGSTKDDAVGEAFDKVAKLLGLGYPGGPIISRLAKSGNPKAFRFTTPKMADQEFNFSFSGIKTAVMHLVTKQNELTPAFVADAAASFQEAAVDFLIEPALSAAEKFGLQAIVIGGGVAANSRLREKLSEKACERGIKVFIPPMNLCTDNAAMIAFAGGKRIENNETSKLSINAVANLEIG